MANVLVLDIDGVLNTKQHREKHAQPPADFFDQRVDDRQRKLANAIVCSMRVRGINHDRPVNVLYHAFTWMQEHLVDNLKMLMKSHGDVKVVLSSSWRLHFTLDCMREVFAYNNFTPDMIGETPVMEDRGDEVRAWLRNNKSSVDKLLILDDRSNFNWGALEGCLLVTDYKVGLTGRQATNAKFSPVDWDRIAK